MAKKIKYDLYGKLKLTTIEREVEDAYNAGISLFFTDNPIQHPFQCDGYVTDGLMLRLLIEYKFDELLSNPVVKARILVQVLFYLKRFEDAGWPLPNVIMVGDKNECFVIHANAIVRYLDENANWSAAPSSAAEENPALVMKIAGDTEINPFVFKIGPGFDFNLVINRINDLAINVKRYVRVTEHNIAEIFEYFSNNVLRNMSTMSAHDIVGTFLGVLLQPMDYYQHPRNRNILVAKHDKIMIYGDAFVSFFDFYNRSYTPQEKMVFTEIADRLIEDTVRRKQGEFFTPTLFVDKAHRMMEDELGEDWKDKYTVWDCCCGTKNLTRDYSFGRLFCSTLMPKELEIAERYNPGAVSFVFDFLNDPAERLPKPLLKALKDNNPLVFLINPPFGTSSTFTAERQKEDGMAETMVARQMRKARMNLASRNLLNQFLYRIFMLTDEFSMTNVYLGLFSKPNYVNSPSYKKFRDYFFDRFAFRKGIYFQASNFADVSNSWGITFNVWTPGRTPCPAVLPHTVVALENGAIVDKDTKSLYNADDTMDTSAWIREVAVSSDKKDIPVLSSGTTVSANSRDKKTGLLPADAFGCYYHIASDVYNSAAYVALFTGNCSHPSGKWGITPENFERVMVTFMARKNVKPEWYNDKDIFLVPDISHPKYRETVADSVVFSLFHSSSQQSSLRDIEWHGTRQDIRNEFFWLSKTLMEQLANENHNDACFMDCRTDHDRFVYQWLKSHDDELSSEAKAVLSCSRQVIVESFPYRFLYDIEFPEKQVDNWDAGWYQIKDMAKAYAPKSFSAFSDAYKRLTEKLRPMIYELKMLK